MADSSGFEGSHANGSPISKSCQNTCKKTAGCPTFVHETVCVQAGVTITPCVEHGPVQSFCVDDPVIGRCQGTTAPSGTCTFIVSQRICVQIPLTFSAKATAVPIGIVCGEPETGLCEGAPCTYSFGFYKNHEDVTAALLALGPIVLGIAGMDVFTYTVTTTAEAVAVLNFNTPAPPSPGSQQYQNLYAQLLAANLNVRRGATCGYALAAIAAANAFLITSPADGNEAAALQGALELFNSGNGPGCPPHCPDEDGDAVPIPAPFALP